MLCRVTKILPNLISPTMRGTLQELVMVATKTSVLKIAMPKNLSLSKYLRIIIISGLHLGGGGGEGGYLSPPW